MSLLVLFIVVFLLLGLLCASAARQLDRYGSHLDLVGILLLVFGAGLCGIVCLILGGVWIVRLFLGT